MPLIDLFDAEGRAAVERLAARTALYAFDFDGTLAPIVERPDDAAAAPSTVALLSRLSSMVPVALITGRSVDDLRRRIPFTPRYLVGNHGSEGLPDALHPSLADAVAGHGGNDRHRTVVQRWLSQWPAAITAQTDDAGIEVEPKAYSLSIHYRRARDHAAAERAVVTAIGALDPPARVIGGKCVFNVLPEGAPDKGQALHALVQHERCDAAFFIGDDVTDEVAFVGAPPSWVTVRVGDTADSAARYSIARQDDIDRCLALLVDVHERRDAGAPAAG